MNHVGKLALTVAGLAFAHGASAVAIFYGTGSTTANADAAFANWSASVSGAVTDQLTGLAGTQGTNAVLTSALGNRFATSDDYAYVANTTFGVIQGTNLQISRAGPAALFNWNLATASNAFGFFAGDIDGGTIDVRFVDGTTVTYTASAAGSSSFWGISGLGSLVSQVAVRTTDPGGVSYWDRFSYGSTAVPEPGSLALLGLGLAGLGLSRRRKSV